MKIFRVLVLASLPFVVAGCSDSGSGETSAATATTSTTSTTTATTGAPSTATDAPTTGSGTAMGSGSEGVTSTATTSTSTSSPTTTTGATGSSGEPPGTSTGADTTTGTTGEPGSSSGGSSSTSTTGAIEPPPPGMLDGCSSCDCCDPWWISWGEVPGATHYVVRWKCSVNPEQVHDVGPKTMIADVCNDIAMCNGMCAFTVGYIKVQACNDDGCSAPVDIPAEDIPITCGGGCCC